MNRAFNITTEEHNELKKALSEGAITLADYEDRLSNTTDQAKAMHISNIFGITASKQWLTLVEQGTGSLEDYTESLENAAGAAKEMAEIKLDNLAGDWVILRSAVSGLLITL